MEAVLDTGLSLLSNASLTLTFLMSLLLREKIPVYHVALLKVAHKTFWRTFAMKKLEGDEVSTDLIVKSSSRQLSSPYRKRRQAAGYLGDQQSAKDCLGGQEHHGKICFLIRN